MTILIFFAIILVTIILAIFFNRLVRCPLLVALIFFSITLLIAIILSNINLVVLAIILGIVAFISAFLDCVIKSSCIFRNNNCLNCYNPYRATEQENNCNNNSLSIVNSNGDVIARIRGNTVNRIDENENNNCGCNGVTGNNILLNNTTENTTFSNETSCNCSRRYRR